MNLTSRQTQAVSGATHSVLPPSIADVLSGSSVAQLGTQNFPNQLNNNGRNGGSALMSLFNSGLSVPRQMVLQARAAQTNVNVTIHLNFVGTIGQGTFGQIERATLTVVGDSSDQSGAKLKPNDQPTLQVAVKRVLQDPRYKNRELGIMQRVNNHPNVVKFFYYYHSTTPSNNRGHRSSSGRSGSSSSGLDLFLHLVLECFPESLCELIYRYLQRDVKLPSHMVKIFTFQMLKALAYLHSHQICHRDIKSSNLLVDESTLVLKVCDFGSAKEMVPGAANVSYISSRYYRAPELLFGAQLYTCAIDTWSGGCVLAEMLRQRCLFMGADSVDQLVKVIRVLGTPSREDIAIMNPMYGSYNFPTITPCPVSLFFPQHTPTDLLSLMRSMLVFNPVQRISPAEALSDPCFNELRELGSHGLLPGRVRIPAHLFDPNPAPVPSLFASSNCESACLINPAPVDTRNWTGQMSKKAGDCAVPTNKRNNGNSAHKQSSHETVKRTQGSSGTEKPGSSSSVNPTTNVSHTYVMGDSPVKVSDAAAPVKKSNPKREETNSGGSRKFTDSDKGANKSDALSNGANEVRKISNASSDSLSQPLKPSGGVTGCADTTERGLNEVSS